MGRKPDEEAVMNMTPLHKVARALTYDVWGYEKPNEQAEWAALAHIDKVQRAAEAAGFEMTFVDLRNQGDG